MAGKAGWLLIGHEGVILDCDDAFCATMRDGRDRIVGTDVLAITAPADHASCIELYHQIKSDGRAFTTVKRIIRADRSHLWVRIECSSPSWTPVSGDIHMDVDECPAPAGWVEPSLLLLAAQSMARTRRIRLESFDPAMAGEPAWDLLLAAYIGEAEGRAVTTASLHAAFGISVVHASRWVRVLAEQGLIEFEEQANNSLITSSIRLTGTAHGKFERFLSRVYREHMDAMPAS